MSKAAIPQLVAQLLHDGVAVARAEVQLFKSKVSTRIAAARTGAIFLAAAGLIAFVSLIGLVTGLVLSLAQIMDPAFAGLVVLFVGSVIAGILGWIGAGHLSSKPEPVIAEAQESVSTALVERT